MRKSVSMVFMLLLLPVSVQAACLSSDQVAAIGLLTGNMSLNESMAVVDLFESLCEQNTTFYVNNTVNVTYNDSYLTEQMDFLNETLFNITGNLTNATDWVNSTQTETFSRLEKLENYTYNLTRNLSENISETFNKWSTEIEDDREDEFIRLGDIFDEKIDTFEDEYVNKSAFDTERNYLRGKINEILESDPYTQYVFYALVVVVACVGILQWRKPQLISTKLKNVTKSKHIIDEEVTESDLRRRTELSRNMKMTVAKERTLTVQDKQKIIDMIQKGTITNLIDLEKEINILKELKKGGKRGK